MVVGLQSGVIEKQELGVVALPGCCLAQDVAPPSTVECLSDPVQIDCSSNNARLSRSALHTLFARDLGVSFNRM